MKKNFTILMLGAIVAFTSCQKDLNSGNNGDGSEISVSIKANIPSELLTKTHGDGVVTRYIMEIYKAGTNELYRRVTQMSGENVFELRLIKGDYDFLFWADHQQDDSELFYDTQSKQTTSELSPTGRYGLKEVTMIEYWGNVEQRDAFYGKLLNKKIDATTTINETVTLTRPFAQLNIATGLKDITTSNVPTAVKITEISVYTKFNVFDGAVSGKTEREWSFNAPIFGAYQVYAADSPYTNLATDYLFATTDGSTVDFTLEFYYALDKITDRVFTNIPVKRNHRTNIVGELMTYGSQITVEVSENFDAEIVEPTQSIGDMITQAAAVGNKPCLTVVVDKPLCLLHAGDTHRTITIADAVTGDNLKEVILDLSAGIIAPLQITDATPLCAENNYKGDITIIVPSGTNSNAITFNVPAAHVVVKGANGTVINEMKATTSNTTLVIEKGITVNALNIEGGNVEVYGNVTTLAKSSENSARTVVKIYDGGSVANASGLDASKWEVINIGDIQNTTTAKYYASLAEALSAARSGETIQLAGKQFDISTITIPQGVTLQGAENSILLAAVQTGNSVSAVNLYGTLKNVKVQYARTATPNKAWVNENVGGVTLFANSTLENCVVANFRNGVYANNVSGITIKGNTITANRTGIQFANAVGALVENNTITNNVTVGVLVQYLSATNENKPIFNNNTITGNWASDFENRFTASVSPYVINLNDGNTFTNGTKTILVAANSNEGSSSSDFEKPTSQTANVVTTLYSNIVLDGSTLLNPVTIWRAGSFVNAYNTIEEGLVASQSNDVIKVAYGTYNAPETGSGNTLKKNWNVGSAGASAKSGITLIGDATQRPILNGTIVLYEGCKLENFEINWVGVTAPANVNAIVYLLGNNQTIKNVKWNRANAAVSPQANGHEVYPINNASGSANFLTVTGCEFVGGTHATNDYYKAIYLNPAVGGSGSSGTITNVTITDNTFRTLHPFSCDAWMPNLTFTGNYINTTAINTKDVGFYRSSENGDAAATSSSNFSSELKALINMCLNQNTWSISKLVKSYSSVPGGTIQITSTIN